MAEPEDLMTPADLDAMEDARERALTLAAIDGDASWPMGSILPLPGGGASIETAYVRAGAALTVLSTEGAVRERRYADSESLVNDGWRVD
jgi:hypothetical protein